ncbi:MAG: NF038104 family lipoprotein [Thioalkalivibrio sp.]|nr:NF038104 family lipoprotein [Thioalkalivibrio sp.]
MSIPRTRRPGPLPLLFLLCLLSSGCTAVKVVDAAASTAIGVTKGTVKTTGRVIGAAIPSGKDAKEDHQ